jgi:chromosome segregation ATPase
MACGVITYIDKTVRVHEARHGDACASNIVEGKTRMTPISLVRVSLAFVAVVTLVIMRTVWVSGLQPALQTAVPYGFAVVVLGLYGVMVRYTQGQLSTYDREQDALKPLHQAFPNVSSLAQVESVLTQRGITEQHAPLLRRRLRDLILAAQQGVPLLTMDLTYAEMRHFPGPERAVRTAMDSVLNLGIAGTFVAFIVSFAMVETGATLAPGGNVDLMRAILHHFGPGLISGLMAVVANIGLRLCHSALLDRQDILAAEVDDLLATRFVQPVYQTETSPVHYLASQIETALQKTIHTPLETFTQHSGRWLEATQEINRQLTQFGTLVAHFTTTVGNYEQAHISVVNSRQEFANDMQAMHRTLLEDTLRTLAQYSNVHMQQFTQKLADYQNTINTHMTDTLEALKHDLPVALQQRLQGALDQTVALVDTMGQAADALQILAQQSLDTTAKLGTNFDEWLVRLQATQADIWTAWSQQTQHQLDSLETTLQQGHTHVATSLTEFSQQVGTIGQQFVDTTAKLGTNFDEWLVRLQATQADTWDAWSQQTQRQLDSLETTLQQGHTHVATSLTEFSQQVGTIGQQFVDTTAKLGTNFDEWLVRLQATQADTWDAWSQQTQRQLDSLEATLQQGHTHVATSLLGFSQQVGTIHAPLTALQQALTTLEQSTTAMRTAVQESIQPLHALQPLQQLPDELKKLVSTAQDHFQAVTKQLEASLQGNVQSTTTALAQSARSITQALGDLHNQLQTLQHIPQAIERLQQQHDQALRDHLRQVLTAAKSDMEAITGTLSQTLPNALRHSLESSLTAVREQLEACQRVTGMMAGSMNQVQQGLERFTSEFRQGVVRALSQP